jgi:hypothetical protein
MDWPGVDVNGVPVFLNPGRPHRARFADRHDPRYFRDGNGFLDPAAGFGEGMRRSASAAGRAPPAAIVINNGNWDDHSPVRGAGRRRSSHGHDHHHFDDDDWDDRAHSPDRGHSPHHDHRPRSRRRGHSHAHESRSPSPFFDPELDRKMRKLEELERKEEEAEQQRRFKERQLLEDAKKAERKKEEEAMKKHAVEEHHIKMLEKQEKERKEKEAADKAFRERVKETFGAAGYSDESIEKILEGKKGKKGEKHEKRIMDLTRPTYIKVNRKYLSPETLDVYNLPWEWDDVGPHLVLLPRKSKKQQLMSFCLQQHDTSFIIIKRWISEDNQEILFEHSRKIRERKLLTNTTVELKKERDQLLLVRRKSPGRKRSTSRSYLFT